MRRFLLRTPKGQLTIVLAILVAIAAPHEGLGTAGPGLAGAIVAAGLIDVFALRWTYPRWQFPSGAILSAMIVAMVLSAQTPWYVVTVTAAAAVASKYVFRTGAANIFNPAAFAVVVLFPVFRSGESWWGALPDAPPLLQPALAISGIFIAQRVNKLPLVVSFLGAYFFLFTAAAFAADPSSVAEVFRAPDLHAVLYFAFFMLTDPPTSPVKAGPQVAFGAMVAALAFAIFETAGAVYYLLAAVLAGNAWEAWRRVSDRRARRLRSAPAAGSL